MAVLNVYKLDGSQNGTIEIKDEIFSITPNVSVMHEVLTAELAEDRQGSASTKNRAAVSGGGKKPFRQKGTGRARQGSTRAPHMVGGGVVHGPKPRSFEKKINKKVRKLALKSALATRFQAGNIVVIDEYSLEVPKTKSFVEFSKALDMVSNKKLFVINDLVEDKDYNLFLSVRNIKDTQILLPNEISVYWLLKSEKLVITKEALLSLEEVLA
ncbi:50S ribosomal protein L4 [Sneathia vaginalis]|uniref:Large ribosomal subunit protein uL4 n=1 Tax=Sneathia vaginalis TaxID=187101 RepID=A0A0E3UU91_9FUSO|nr:MULTISPECIES: 50S ribosomal protein L4 [Sneathia]AKC95078.1 50S ribosomal protein L4 [Sneathia vaginalis]MBE2989240.1 50S ribosomal protein L4 [Sneathia sp. DSM 16630]MBE3031198.1 50S ribosomal protein L4 [Sneathia sp. DSM 16631]MDK9581541.1 50S ribosomal protein L4 [Sneathia vaginalis]